MIARVVLASAAALVLAGCGASPAPPAAGPAAEQGPAPSPIPTAAARQAAMTQTDPAPPAPTRPAPAPAASAKDAEAAERALPPMTYDSKGRRDPFEQLQVTTGAKGLTVAAARLTGIVRNDRNALALVEAPDGIGYVLRTGDTLGDGRLIEITGDSAVFVMASRAGTAPSRLTLRLSVE